MIFLSHDVGDVDEGQHDPLLLHLRLLGDPEVVGAAHTKAGLTQEPKEEEDHLLLTSRSKWTKTSTSGMMSSALPSTGKCLRSLVSSSFTIVSRSQYLGRVIVVLVLCDESCHGDVGYDGDDDYVVPLPVEVEGGGDGGGGEDEGVQEPHHRRVQVLRP